MKSLLLATVGFCIAMPVSAQTNAPTQPVASANTPDEAQGASQTSDYAGDIVVTAQKRAERLSDTPQTVNVVTGTQINELNLTNFEDIAKVVPGLQISRGDGRQQAVSMRGVTFDPDTGTTATVDLYLNEVPFDATQAINAQFDIGSIQVLRGPQGTLRGGTGPSGAVLIGTHNPSLTRFEVNGTASYTGNDTNLQGGVSIPFISDVLSVRLAGLYDHGNGNEVQNIRTNAGDFNHAWGARATILFRPTSDLQFQLMHQEFRSNNRGNFQVISTPGKPTGIYGAISADDRAAVQLGPADFQTKGSVTILNANWDFAGNRLSYVGGYQDNQFNTIRDLNIGGALTPAYFGPFGGIPYAEYQAIYIRNKVFSNELRFERTGEHFWLYRFGVYLNNTTTPFAGSFDYTGTTGSCTGPLSAVGLPCFTLGGGVPPRTHSRGYFTSQTFNFTRNDTLDLGARYSTHATVSADPSQYHAWTGTASYKHRFSAALLAYINVGTSFRPGGFAQTEAATAAIPLSFFEYKAERSKSIELGLKGSFLNGRLFYSVSGFYQKFENFINRANNIACTRNPNGVGPLPGTVYPTTDGMAPNGANSCGGSGVVLLTFNAPASSRGIEFELRGNVVHNWTIGLNIAYANAHYDNTAIPCNDYNGDGTPDQATAPAVQAGHYFSVCSSSGTLTNTPKLQGSVNSEVNFDLAGGFRPFVRGVARYQGNRMDAFSGVKTASDVLVDGFIGLRTPFGVELSVFARNLTNQQTATFAQPIFGLFGDETGYTYGSKSLGRQVGVLLRADY